MQWIWRFRDIFTCHSNTNFLVIRYFYLLSIPLHGQKLSNFMCIIIFYISSHLCVYIDIKSTPCAILRPRVSSVSSYSKVGTARTVQNSYVTLFWFIPLLSWESEALGTINGQPSDSGCHMTSQYALQTLQYANINISMTNSYV